MTTYAQQLQLSIIAGAQFKGEKLDNHTLASGEDFLEGKFEHVLESSKVAEQLLRTPVGDESRNIGNYVKKNLETLFQGSCENPGDRGLEVLVVGASCLQLFVQNNWLGPGSEKDPLYFCHANFKDHEKKVLAEILEDFEVDGEEAYAKANRVIYLYLAKAIFLEGRPFSSDLETWDWWLMRCLLAQQSLLQEKSPTLKATVMEIIDNLAKREPLMTDNLFRDVQILFNLEAGYACHDYLEYRKAVDHFNAAKKISGLNVSLTGAMGKRTRYQEFEKAQLVLKVSREDGQDHVDCMFEVPSGVPKVLPLNDDTVLDDIKFTDDDASSTPQLSAFDQVLVLGLMESYRRSVAEERLTTEEVLTYLAYLIHHSTNWSVTAAATHLRSMLERDSGRRVERSMMQLEVISKMTLASSSTPEFSIRTPLFYATHLSPTWIMKRDYATVLTSLGLTGEALDVFESLEMWENVIGCYQRLKKLEKAESLIRERLAIKETPSLLCYLGDVTNKLEDYQKAWELSKHRSSRAQRCMGYLHFNRREYESAIECFTKSLEINPLQIPLWFTYGCAAMTCEKYDLGAKGFRRCVHIDYDNFEAWSNLATCFVRLKDKKKAFSVLRDALKCNYGNWRLWENSLVIGIDVGEFNDVIGAYHRLIDIKKKWIDNEILRILTKVVTEKLLDADGNPADRYHGKLMELFGRITSTVTGEGDIWSNYAKLSMMKYGEREPDMDKVLQHLQKAYRCYSQAVGWEKDFESCNKVGGQAVKLAETYLQCSEGKTQQEGLRVLSAAKLMLRGAHSMISKQHTDPVTQELPEQVRDICTKLDTLLQDIVSKIDALRS